ncbi:hypothetical protein TNCV_4543641 [Trichonephila clavipes]|nr:hypothetical protein TNCV_4543641 [Trichonephila clavipes]
MINRYSGGRWARRGAWPNECRDLELRARVEKTFPYASFPLLSELLQGVPTIATQNVGFLHEGAPAHFSIAVYNHRHAIYLGRWIRRGRPVAWPPRSLTSIPWISSGAPEIACVSE